MHYTGLYPTGGPVCKIGGDRRAFGIIDLVVKVKELQRRLEQAQEQVRLFQQISRLMSRDQSLQETLQGIVDLVHEYLRADSCLLYLTDRDELVLCATSPPRPGVVGRVRLRWGEGLTGWVAQQRRLVAISRGAYNDPRSKLFRELPEDRYEAILSVPVVARSRVVGVINVQHQEPHAHTGEEMELLTTVGEQIGCLLVLARMPAEALDEVSHAALVLSPSQEASAT